MRGGNKMLESQFAMQNPTQITIIIVVLLVLMGYGLKKFYDMFF